MIPTEAWGDSGRAVQRRCEALGTGLRCPAEMESRRQSVRRAPGRLQWGEGGFGVTLTRVPAIQPLLLSSMALPSPSQKELPHKMTFGAGV